MLTKTADDPVVSAGEGIGFTIVVTNNGAGVAKGATVSDPLPANAGTGWSIDPDPAATDPGWTIDAGVLRYGPADLASGASVKVHIVSGTTAATCGQVDNQAFVTTANDGKDDDTSDVTVECPDVRILKTADNSPILAGQTASFTIKAWNDGPGTAFDVVVTDQLPSGIAWTDDSDSCDIDSGVLTCKLGTVGPDDDAFSVTISGPSDAESCADIPNAASVEASNEPAANTGNDSSRDEIDVQCASIDLVKTAGIAADGDTLHLAQPGDVVFTYVVTNTGTATLEHIALVDDNATPGNTADDVTVVCPKSDPRARRVHDLQGDHARRRRSPDEHRGGHRQPRDQPRADGQRHGRRRRPGPRARGHPDPDAEADPAAHVDPRRGHAGPGRQRAPDGAPVPRRDHADDRLPDAGQGARAAPPLAGPGTSRGPAPPVPGANPPRGRRPPRGPDPSSGTIGVLPGVATVPHGTAIRPARLSNSAIVSDNYWSGGHLTSTFGGHRRGTFEATAHPLRRS